MSWCTARIANSWSLSGTTASFRPSVTCSGLGSSRTLLKVLAERAQSPQRVLGDEDVVARQSRHGLDAGRRVHGISDDREVASSASAKCPDHDSTRVHTQPDPEAATDALPHALSYV